MADKLIYSCLVLVICVSACGSSHSTATEVRVASDSATTTIKSTTTTTLASIADDDFDWDVAKTNLNDRSTPIGTLCWLVWEIARQKILIMESVGDALAIDPARSFKGKHDLDLGREVYKEINKEVRFAELSTDKLPAELVTFADSLYTALRDQLKGHNVNDPLLVLIDESPETHDVMKILISSPGCVLPI